MVKKCFAPYKIVFRWNLSDAHRKNDEFKLSKICDNNVGFSVDFQMSGRSGKIMKLIFNLI